MEAKLIWFEIPVTNFERAQHFYETILDESVHVMDLGNLKMGFLPGGEGALCKNEHYEPSDQGVLLYLDANPDIASILDRVEEAGGQVIQGRKLISPDRGYMGLILDSEGNRIALMSQH